MNFFIKLVVLKVWELKFYLDSMTLQYCYSYIDHYY